MESFDLIVSHILQNTNDNATKSVTALQSHTPFAVCVSSKKPTSSQVVTRSESTVATALLELSKLKGKELEDLLRKNELKISGKVEEKRQRLKDFYST